MVQNIYNFEIILVCLQQWWQWISWVSAQPEEEVVHQLHQLGGGNVWCVQGRDSVLHEKVVLQVCGPWVKGQGSQATPAAQESSAQAEEVGVWGVWERVQLPLRSKETRSDTHRWVCSSNSFDLKRLAWTHAGKWAREVVHFEPCSPWERRDVQGDTQVSQTPSVERDPHRHTQVSVRLC